jgi:hypothetical protein
VGGCESVLQVANLLSFTKYSRKFQQLVVTQTPTKEVTVIYHLLLAWWCKTQHGGAKNCAMRVCDNVRKGRDDINL